MNINYYDILEIPTDADQREIKRAYHRLARELHPDKAPSPEEARTVEERFAQVSAAYNTLKDSEKRAEYDKIHRRNGAQTKSPATTRVLQAGRGAPKSGVLTQDRGAAPSAPATGGVTPERVAIAQKAYARGLQFYKDDNLAKAIGFFEAAIQNNDQEAAYHAKLAMALIKQKKSATRAITAAQKAIELDPYNLEHKFDLAFIYETIGSNSNARRIYEEILR